MEKLKKKKKKKHFSPSEILLLSVWSKRITRNFNKKYSKLFIYYPLQILDSLFYYYFFFFWLLLCILRRNPVNKYRNIARGWHFNVISQIPQFNKRDFRYIYITKSRLSRVFGRFIRIHTVLLIHFFVFVFIFFFSVISHYTTIRENHEIET